MPVRGPPETGNGTENRRLSRGKVHKDPVLEAPARVLPRPRHRHGQAGEREGNEPRGRRHVLFSVLLRLVCNLRYV